MLVQYLSSELDIRIVDEVREEIDQKSFGENMGLASVRGGVRSRLNPLVVPSRSHDEEFLSVGFESISKDSTNQG